MADKKNERQAFRIDAVLFDLIIFGFFLLLAIMSLNYNPRARSIPLALGILGSAMMFLQFLVDALPRVRSKLRFVSQSGILTSERQTQSKELDIQRAEVVTVSDKTAPSSQEEIQSKAAEWWRVFRVILWLVAFIALLAFTHYLIAVGAFVILVTRWESKESWRRSITLALCVNAAFYLLFNIILKAQL